MRLGSAAIAAVTLAAVVSGCTPDGGESSLGPSPSGAPQPLPADPPPEITVPHATLAGDVPLRLADGVTPPTNRWYSSLAIGDPGMPVFPKPLSVTPVDGGVTFGLTRPVASANAILAPASSDITVTIDGASGVGIVTRANPVGAELSWADASLSIAQGSPVIAVMADAGVTLSADVAFEEASSGVGSATVNGTDYGVVIRDGALVDGEIELEAGGSAQFFAVPGGGSLEEFASALGGPVDEVAWAGAADETTAVTSLDYGVPTVLTMPTTRAADAGLDCGLGTYDTIDGEFAVCAADTVTWIAPAVSPSAELDFAAISDAERLKIAAALESDVASLSAPASDSYFGGKHLYRIANLLTIALALGEESAADALRAELVKGVREWGDADRCEAGEPRCFVYDPTLRGIVGITPAFGSEQFNDHHFHYGYLLYAAAVAVEVDPALADEIGPVFDQVAADIASGATTESFPEIRVFDPVAGHSWASGPSTFADGNNQESSSEAVSAWNAVALWGSVRGDAGIEQRARWMLAMEADAARRLWLEPDLSAFPAYEHDIVAIEWGAKRDYATWFSAEPAAMLGIELIPMAPIADDYLSAVDPAIAASSLAAAAPQGFDVMFGDYLLMYAAVSGDLAASVAWNEALALPDERIDDGDSRTYLLAFIASLDS